MCWGWTEGWEFSLCSRFLNWTSIQLSIWMLAILFGSATLQAEHTLKTSEEKFVDVCSALIFSLFCSYLWWYFCYCKLELLHSDRNQKQNLVHLSDDDCHFYTICYNYVKNRTTTLKQINVGLNHRFQNILWPPQENYILCWLYSVDCRDICKKQVYSMSNLSYSTFVFDCHWGGKKSSVFFR